MQIKEFASRVALTPDTIRFYEKRGLLAPSRQANNKYRKYGESEIEIVRQIQIGQALGFTLAEIKRGAGYLRNGKLTPALEISMMQAKLDEIDRKSAELRRIRSYLRKKIEWIQTGRKTRKPEL